MSVVTLSPKFQVVIPSEARKQLGLKAGEKLDVHITDGHIEMVRVLPLNALRGIAKGPNNFTREKDREF